MIEFFSVCSGIESASVAWLPLGWHPVGYSEIDGFACRVLKHRHPSVPVHGDFTELRHNPPDADLLVGGNARPGDNIQSAGYLMPVCTASGQANAEILADGLAPTLTLTLLHEAPIVTSSPSISGPLRAKHNLALRDDMDTIITHALKAEGFDASEDGSGRGVPLVAHAFDARQSDVHQHGDIAGTLDVDGFSQAVGFSAKDHGQDAGDVAPTLRAMSHAMSHANGGGQVAVAFVQNSRSEVRKIGGDGGVVGALAVDAGAQQQAYMQQGMQVRRLTPVECERLQGFPEAREQVMIDLCFDHQAGCVIAEVSCPRSQSAVSLAADVVSMPSADPAADPFSIALASRDWLAALRVGANCGDELRELHSRGRLLWSAGGAGTLNGSLQPTLIENTVRSIAAAARDLAQAVRSGKVASPLSIRLSMRAKPGKRRARGSGGASAENASDAASGQMSGTFTIADLGRLRRSSDRPIATSLCSVFAAIAGCIPNETLSGRFSILVDLASPYTRIPMRFYKRRKITKLRPADMWDKVKGGWMLMSADGPRYKVLGNSFPVPVIRWIGERIQMQLDQCAPAKSAK